MGIGKPVSYKSTHIPKEPVGNIAAAYNDSVVDREIGQRVIAISLGEIGDKGVGEVLSAFLVAVGYNDAESLAVFRGYAAQNFAYERIKMILKICRGEFVNLQACTLGCGRAVGDAGRSHAGAHDCPASVGCVPFQAVALAAIADIYNLL